MSWKEQLLPKHPMAEAVNYALGQWEELNVFCSDGAVPIDNNVSEREMKRVVLNRKNSLFVGNPRGGRTAAILASLTSTCRRHDVDPQLYLTQLLINLPSLTRAANCPPGCPTSGSGIRLLCQRAFPSSRPALGCGSRSAHGRSYRLDGFPGIFEICRKWAIAGDCARLLSEVTMNNISSIGLPLTSARYGYDSNEVQLGPAERRKPSHRSF